MFNDTVERMARSVAKYYGDVKPRRFRQIIQYALEGDPLRQMLQTKATSAITEGRFCVIAIYDWQGHRSIIVKREFLLDSIVEQLPEILCNPGDEELGEEKAV